MQSPVAEITVEYAGAAFRGRFHTTAETLHVASPYGGASAALGEAPQAPDALAKLVLWGLAQAWTRRCRAAAEAKSA